MVRRRSLSRSEVAKKITRNKANVGREVDLPVPATSSRKNPRSKKEVLNIVESADENETEANATFEVKKPADKALSSKKGRGGKKNQAEGEEGEKEGEEEEKENEVDSVDDEENDTEETPIPVKAAPKKTAKATKKAKVDVTSNENDDVRKSTRVKMPIQFFSAAVAKTRGNKRKATNVKGGSDDAAVKTSPIKKAKKDVKKKDVGAQNTKVDKEMPEEKKAKVAKVVESKKKSAAPSKKVVESKKDKIADSKIEKESVAKKDKKTVDKKEEKTPRKKNVITPKKAVVETEKEDSKKRNVTKKK